MWHKLKEYPMYEISANGEIRHIKSKRLKKTRINDFGYLVVSINQLAKPKMRRVHNLLAQAFIDNPNNYTHINHIDGNKLNNKLSNLEWCNILQNNQHAFKLGLIDNTGEKNGMSKLTKEKVIEIKKLLKSGDLSQYKIANLFNVSRSCVLKIHLCKTWNHVSI
jgi:predicted XRE-type DNA-binding protein